MKKSISKFLILCFSLVVIPTVLNGCQGSQRQQSETGLEPPPVTQKEDGVEKPEKITVMVDGTFNATQQNYQAEWIARYQDLTGIELEIIQPDHDNYYNVVGQTFAGDDWPDVVLLNSAYYAGYAQEGVLWDMTDVWDQSELKQSVLINQAPVEGNRIDGRLYGFARERGNGCITYIKKRWLDNCDLSVPENYEEYLAMLEIFTTGDPDGNGIQGDTYGVSAAGILGAEDPYIIYLPEFYQNAYPSFYQKEDGTWVDGFTESSMKEAIERLQNAYAKGYLDKEVLTNGTEDCRNKFYEDRFGVFTYWAGTWNVNLKLQLEANGYDGEVIPIPPVKEVGSYLERTAPVYAITTACKNPEGVYRYFIESMVDGGEIEKLWCYGVEGYHWSDKAETVCGHVYEEGQFHRLENQELPGTQFTKVSMDPLLAIAGFTDGDPGQTQRKPEAEHAQELFNSNSRIEPFPVATEVMSQYNGDLIRLKNILIANCVVQGNSIEEEYARFEKEHGMEWSQAITDSLNR